jgi:hypothetical protein
VACSSCDTINDKELPGNCLLWPKGDRIALGKKKQKTKNKGGCIDFEASKVCFALLAVQEAAFFAFSFSF